MEFKVDDRMKEKIKLVAVSLGILLGFFLFFCYIFPFIWPIVVSVCLALMIYPAVRWLHRRLHINKIVGTIFILLLAFCIIGGAVCFLVDKLMAQITLFASNFDYYQNKASDMAGEICSCAERFLHVERGVVYEFLSYEMEKLTESMGSKVMNTLIGTSIPAVKTMIDFIVAVAIMIVVLLLVVKDMEEIKAFAKNCVFGSELKAIYKKSVLVFKAYVKAQVIIMGIVAAVCVLGLTFAQNRYAWLLGISVGVLDALPLFGAGAILIPVTLFYLLKKEFLKAAILFTTFMACYFIREFLEPKLMGDKIGVHPLVTLIGIYVGYKLFGLLGIFAGVFVVIVLSDTLRAMKK